MKIDYGLEMSQSQKIIVSTNLVQSLKILSMTTLELEDEIKKQAEENPIIEVEMQNSERKVDWERYINHLKHHTYNDKNESRYNADSEMDFENIISNNQNLYDYLKEQINCYKIDKTEEKVCEYIIDSLDENGYLKDEDLVIKDLNIDCTIYNRCKKYIQSLEPSGVGGSNLEESLIIQLRNLDIKDGLLEDIIKNDLNCIGNKKISLICKKYNINKSQCMNYIKLIKSLNPTQYCYYLSKSTKSTVKKIDGEFVLEGNDTNDINIHINSFYKEILNDESSDIVAKEFIKDRLDNALNLIKSIEHRKSTTIMIANSILNKQKDFFEKGIHYIKPMKMQELAQELNIHQSTISRGVNGKYMLTPFGLFEFKYFFSKGLETQETEGVSSISIKKFIKDTIKNEDKSKPLSDEKIKVMLNNQGINIARRTVSKYREELEILPSSKRKL